MIYFITDAHLGSRLKEDPREHEMRVVNWLDQVKADARKIFMLGDMFDFWFEYKTVVPKGYVRFLGKMAELVDAGIEIHFFTGNHDIWTFGYLEEEVGLIVHRGDHTFELNGKKFFMAHGDAQYQSEKSFNIIRKVFHSRLAQKMFRLLPPQIGQNFGYGWSRSNRAKYIGDENNFMGEEREPLVVFAKKYSAENPVDFILFGHRHIELNLQLNTGAQLVIPGDFFSLFTYAVFDGEELWVESF